MAWQPRFRRKSVPDNVWLKCPNCDATLFHKDLEKRRKVCPECDYHLRCSARERVRFTLDEGSWEELFADLEPTDRLGFVDEKPYPERLAEAKRKSGLNEAVIVGLGRIGGREVVFGSLDFGFLGGSMGVIVGEKVTLAVETALERKLPLVLVSTSGGARMQEGALSLMQMAKTCSALGEFDEAGGLFISVLADPTYGGVTASFATVADLLIAEPGARIGFAGPRVIKNTMRTDLPEEFQSAEFLLERGQIDCIVPRLVLREEIARFLDYLARPEAAERQGEPLAAEPRPASGGGTEAAEEEGGEETSGGDGAGQAETGAGGREREEARAGGVRRDAPGARETS